MPALRAAQFELVIRDVPPLILSFSPWEKGRPFNGCERTPSPTGRGLG